MFVPTASNLGLLAQSETSTATWAVLMVIVGALISGLIVVIRAMHTKVQTAQGETNASESKLADARHDEMKTLVGRVGDDVKAFDHRMDKVEDRVSKVEIGHAELHEQVKGMKGGHGHE
jgi:uncharacterized protein HemX